MKLSNSSAVPVYTVSGSSTARSLPEWLSQKRQRDLKKDPEYANRIELLQDFEFEEASQCIRISEDGEWVMSTGTYKPQIHTHYLPNLALSWARHTNTLNKSFQILSSDYSKTVHLQQDRSLEFHTPGGCHHRLRIPRYGRDLLYNRDAAEILVPSVGVNANGLGAVFRISLEDGRFMREYEIDVGGDDMSSAGGGALQGGIRTGSVNTGAIAEKSHNLMAFGTSVGTVEYWDSRSRARVATFAIPSDLEGRPEVTALNFHHSGIDIAVGTSSGLIYLYDLRSRVPTLTKDQGYGYPIQHVQYLTQSSSTRHSMPTHSEPKILSSDKRILKIWDERTGAPWTAVEPSVDINCVAWCPDSGMLLTANEGKQQHAFFIPQLGPAPKWCSFLDNVVEEMAEDPNDPNAFSASLRKSGEVYDNYKFLTPLQLRQLNLDHLIGKTNLLRPYMHGFFVAQRLHEEARIIANPTSWEEERSKRVQARIEKERESRIRGKKKIEAKVNRRLAERAMEREEKEERRRARKLLQGPIGKEEANESAAAEAVTEGEPKAYNERTGLLADSRFAALFQDEDFAVDEASREFELHNPSTQVRQVSSNQDKEKGLTAVEEELIDQIARSSDSNDDTSDDDDDSVDTARDHKARQVENDNVISLADYRHRPTKQRRKQEVKRLQRNQNPSRSVNGMRMSISSSSPRNNQHLATHDRSFGSRAEGLDNTARSRNRRSGPDTAGSSVFGEKVATFEPRGSSGGRNFGQRADAGSGGKGDKKDRRSASGNTFRKM